MAAPLLRSIFKPTDFDLFLDEVGLSDLPPEDRVKLTERFAQAVEYGIVTKIFRQLPLEKQTEWVGLMQTADKTGDETPVNDFLAREYPEIETLVDEVIEDVKNEFRLSSSNLGQVVEDQLAMLQRGEGQTVDEYREETLGVPSPEELTPPTPTTPTDDQQVDSIRDQLSSLNVPEQPLNQPNTSTDDAITQELDSVDQNPTIP